MRNTAATPFVERNLTLADAAIVLLERAQRGAESLLPVPPYGRVGDLFAMETINHSIGKVVMAKCCSYGADDASDVRGPALVTSSDEATLRFIAASFKSVWALELLLALKRVGGECTQSDLVRRLQASDLVVSKALDSLVTAGLIANDADTAIYLPANRSIAASVELAEELYRLKPDAVRRAIINAQASGITAFADAFRLRKDSDD